MPFTEDMIWRAAKQAADGFLRQRAQNKLLSAPIVSATDNTTGMPTVGHPFHQRCFVVGKEGALSDIEMMKCEHCEMWHPMGRVCPCMWLEESELTKHEEPEFEAILDAPAPEMVPCPCLRVLDVAGQKAYGPNFVCTICKGKLVVPKG